MAASRTGTLQVNVASIGCAVSRREKQDPLFARGPANGELPVGNVYEGQILMVLPSASRSVWLMVPPGVGVKVVGAGPTGRLVT
jgi:hypothetical protein